MGGRKLIAAEFFFFKCFLLCTQSSLTRDSDAVTEGHWRMKESWSNGAQREVKSHILKRGRDLPVVQWLRIRLAMQGVWAWSLIWEDPHAVEQLRICTTTTEPYKPWAQVLEPQAQAPWSPRLHAQSCQSCPTLCDPPEHSLPGSSVHEILQARALEWIAMPTSRESSWLRGRTWVFCIPGGFLTAEPPGKPPRAHAPQPKRPLQWEAHAPQPENNQHSPQLEKGLCSKENPAQPK